MSEKPMEIDAKIRFVQSTIEPMAWHTYASIASVIGVEDIETGRHVGSALRFSIAGRRTILTAAHVIHEARRSERFAVSAARGQPPFELHGAPDRVDEERDLAAYFLTDDYPSDGIAFWPEDRVDATDGKLSTDYLFVHGFPERRSRFAPLLGGLVSQSFPYGVMLREDDLPADMKSFQFAMDFDPSNMFLQDGKPAEWLDPHGLSGSPVWRIGATGQKMDAWKPELAMLVGVVTAWRPDEKLLLATKVTHVLSLLRS
ncbi:hypothetical protein [Sorangium sp. So ce1024]|uniref:hypothetical protein n=1 Tax=unclassified Sorangium TaxID=2621164 RepID=UPI003F09951C